MFDVVGRLFANRSLRDYLKEALTDEGEAVARVGEALRGERVRELDASAPSTANPARWRGASPT